MADLTVWYRLKGIPPLFRALHQRPNTTGESEEYVENNGVDENATVADDTTAVEEPEEPVENVSQPIVVVKRNQ